LRIAEADVFQEGDNLECLQRSIYKQLCQLLRLDDQQELSEDAFDQILLGPKQGGLGALDVKATFFTAQVASMIECEPEIKKILGFALNLIPRHTRRPGRGDDASSNEDIFRESSLPPEEEEADYDEEEAVHDNREDEQEYEDEPGARCIAKLHNETATLYHELQETFSVPAFTTSMDEISKELWTLLEEDFQWPALETLLLQDEDGNSTGKVQHKLNLIVKKLRMKQFIAKNVDNDPRHIARMLSSSDEGEALITTIPAYPDLRFPADGAIYVHALRTRLG